MSHFSPAWFAAGVVTPESAADFARFAAANPDRSPRSWRWAAFRDWVEENTPLTAEQCRAAFVLAQSEPDANLATALMCAMLYQSKCPPDVRAEATGSEHAGVRRAAILIASGRD